MLTSDLDLLRIDPRVFIDASAEATSLLNTADGVLSGTTLTSATVDFEAAGVDSGHVVVVNGEVLEIVDRSDASTLEVSRPRASSIEPPVPPASGSALAIDVPTFLRLLQRTEIQILAALGVDSSHPTRPVETTAILNPDDVASAVAVQTMAQLYGLAASRAPGDATLAAVQQGYEAAAIDARQRTVVRLDLDGDGLTDSTRRFGVVTFTAR